MTAAIVANGDFPRKDYPLWLLKNADVVVCCDSATSVRRLEKLGVENPANFFEHPSNYCGLAAVKSKRLAQKYKELMK